MMPVQWHFKQSRSQLSGFVMKFWKWNENDVTAAIKTYQHSDDDSSAVKRSNHSTMEEKQSTAHGHNSKEFKDFDAFEHLIQKRHSYTIDAWEEEEEKMRRRRIERNLVKMSGKQQQQHSSNNKIHTNNDSHSNNVSHNNDNNSNNNNNNSHNNINPYKMHKITENVILIIFMGADTRIENTSQSSIVQFCQSSTDRKTGETVCQPEVKNQETSMLITDLDQDGSQEFVSFAAMYEYDNAPTSRNWKLVTYVRLLRLQDELPKYYEKKANNNDN